MRRKKAKKECYKGSSGKSLQWDPIKKRWKIPGAELEEEEVKVAPPPKFGGVKTAEARPVNRYASSFIAKIFKKLFTCCSNIVIGGQHITVEPASAPDDVKW